MYFKTYPLQYLFDSSPNNPIRKTLPQQDHALCVARAASNLGFPQVATSHLGERSVAEASGKEKRLKAICSGVIPNRWKAKWGKLLLGSSASPTVGEFPILQMFYYAHVKSIPQAQLNCSIPSPTIIEAAIGHSGDKPLVFQPPVFHLYEC